MTSIFRYKLVFFILLALTMYGCAKKSQNFKPEIYTGPEIHNLVIQGNLTAIKSMLHQNPALISSQDQYGNTPLHLAAFHGHAEIVKFLIEQGADVNTQNNFGGTALLLASYSGQEEVVKILIANNAKVDLSLKDSKQQVLQIATLEGYRDYNHMYNDKGGIINIKIHFIGSPLQAAAANGHKGVAELLITNGTNVNAKTLYNGNTSLHSAAVNGQKELVELLIANGADVNARDTADETPLCLAMFWCREGGNLNSAKNVAEVLIDSGADVNAKNRAGFTPLHYAAAWGTKEIVELLILAGADINAKSYEGDTPLNTACRYRRKTKGGVIDLLHKHGAVRRHGENNSYDYEPDLIGRF
jgi:ankyrin repeat protein